MAKTKTLYVANDGTEFDTEAAADARNAFLESEFKIEAYIEYADLQKAQAGLMRRHLSGFEAFLKREDLDELVEASKARIEAERAAEAAAAAKAKAEAKAAADAKAAAAPAAGDTEPAGAEASM